jgi:hypothetical protein
MDFNNDMNDGLTDLYSKYLVFADEMAQHHDAMAIAAVMMAQALSIYKTALSEDDYNNIVDVMSISRDSVKTFHQSNLQ